MAKKPDTKQVDQAAASTLEDHPIGMLPDGKLNIVQRDDPPFEPTIVDDDGNVIEEGDEDDEFSDQRQEGDED